MTDRIRLTRRGEPPTAEYEERIARALWTSIKPFWGVFPKGATDTPEAFAEARLDLARHAVRCVVSAIFDPPVDADGVGHA